MGKKTSETSSTTTLPQWASNAAQSGANTILNTVNNNQGDLQGLANSIRGVVPDLRRLALGDDGGIAAASKYGRQVLGGKFLNSNPFINQLAQHSREVAGNEVNSTFSGAGRTGSMSHARGLAKGVADSNNMLRYGAYNQERQNQQQMAGMMPQLYASKFAGIPSLLGAAQTAGQLPYTGLGALSGMGNLWGGQGTTTQTQPGGWGTQLLGAAASALPFILSERSKKTNIELIRTEADGLGWYRFAYKVAPDVMLEGPMADEVEKLRPWALGPRLADGSRTVNYAEIRRAA